MHRIHSDGHMLGLHQHGTNVGHVGPTEDMTTVCNQEEADTWIVLHRIRSLNGGFSSVLAKTSDSSVMLVSHSARSGGSWGIGALGPAILWGPLQGRDPMFTSWGSGAL